MTNETKNVPELRFPGFEDEWEETKIKNISNTFSGGTPASNKTSYYNGNIPFIRSGEIAKLSTELHINNNALQNSLAKLIEKGDLLFALYGATSGEVAISKIKGAINQAILCIRTSESVLFLYNFFKLKKDHILSVYIQGGQGNLSAKIVKNLSVNLPSIKEQQKIGDFFSKLDRQIELEEKKLEQLEAQKKGYMQRIFSQELRFKDENGNDYPEWEEKKIGDIAKIQNGYAFKSSLFVKAGLSILRISDITNSVVKKGTVYYPENIDIPKRFNIYKGDILIAMSGATTGKIGMYIDKEESMLNQRVGKFIPTKDTDNNFLYVYLSSAQFRQSLISLLVAGAQPNVSTKDLENITLDVPSYTEQQQIGYFFNKFDVLINNKKQKLNLLKQRKQGFLQKMFV